MAEPVRARRLTELEGRRLQQIVRRGKHESIRVRRAMMIMASAADGRRCWRLRGWSRPMRTRCAMSSMRSTRWGWPRWTLSGWAVGCPRPDQQ
jgi:hypothetical protein